MPALGEPDSEHVVAWLTHEIAATQDDVKLQGLRISWVREDHWWPDETELARLAREVPGHPDHPERLDLARYLRHKSGRPTMLPRTAWSLDSTTWRLSEDLTDPEFVPGSFWDKVVTPTSAFSLTHDSITIMDPTEGFPPGQNLGSLSSELFGNIRLFLFGGLSALRQGPHVTSARCAADGTWVARVSIGKPDAASHWEAEVSGRWDDQLERGFVKVIAKTAPASSAATRATTIKLSQAGDWVMDESLGRWRADRVETFDENGRLKHVFRFVAAENVPDEEFKRVFDAPKPGSSDAYRGQVLAQGVYDMRSGAYTRQLPDGRRAQQPISPAAMSPHAGTSFWLRVTGWATGAGIVCFLVWLKLRTIRKRPSSTLP